MLWPILRPLQWWLEQQVCAFQPNYLLVTWRSRNGFQPCWCNFTKQLRGLERSGCAHRKRISSISQAITSAETLPNFKQQRIIETPWNGNHSDILWLKPVNSKVCTQSDITVSVAHRISSTSFQKIINPTNSLGRVRKLPRGSKT